MQSVQHSMSEEQPRRRSRGTQPQSYRFEDEYSFLDEDGSGPSGTQTPNFQEDPQDDGDDFMPDVQEEEQEEEVDDDVDEGEDDDDEEDEEDSDEEFNPPRKHSARDISVMEVDSIQEPSTPNSKGRKKFTDDVRSPIAFSKGGGVKVPTVDNDRLRTRGIADFSKIGGQEIRLKHLFGPGSEALKPVLATRDYWYKQETLPLRQSGGLKRSFFESQDARERENRVTRKWFADTGKAAFAIGQKSRKLNAEEGQSYLASARPNSLNILSGIVDEPHLTSLKKGSFVSVAEPFKESKDRPGWLFNLGARIQEAQWAANEESSTQYLAVAVEQEPTGRQSKPMENPKAPAFTATHSYPASIQIWSFEATKDGELDIAKEPRLESVICTDWGAPKHFRWCPIQATDGSGLSFNDTTVHVGLLAAIWSDARVRILNVCIPKSDVNTTKPLYLHYSRAAFDISLPMTIPTCLHWLSGTSLAVGTAAGTVAIWTLTQPGTFASVETNRSSPKPWFYQHLADTYILTISSGWPSQPQFLSISIADGFARLFDLRSPNADYTASIRGRTLCVTQAWHEQTQSFAMPDEHYILKHNPVRRYYHNLYSMRSESSITRIATSPVHPGVLVGGVDGAVEVSNPVGRITNYKVIPWQQKWFVHEWRRPVEQLVLPTATPEEDDAMVQDAPVEELSSSATHDENGMVPSGFTSPNVSQSVLSQPLVRITEGYKATQPGIQHSIMSKKPTNPEIGKGITVFEEPSAITALAWNPNLKFGTWAVAGMGSGLLRVEDVGV
ncbi:uncharacterized protein K460DRAFT_319597 [Cucurbitaria berberidis CBS 394.84]|uniref:Transcription factor TFIIIC complex subunit Tfc6 n=1 Tax=Cucurbitaria berberidis CBS 394.84 TaxID=1168544 RepID=A0A9P4GA43_9PLEO|nr:uncharacterized protein K460DRAFT_319597 [Cucurbitaria berberidis CBS 394.84]KAF1841978.1 hypothetical protein K460DRAFT_319597 [Cucurbitaria berberidis CBS 394.84]